MAKKLSKVAERGDGQQLLCPNCGGASLAGGMLAPKSRVKCETCSAVYKRG